MHEMTQTILGQSSIDSQEKSYEERMCSSVSEELTKIAPNSPQLVKITIKQEPVETPAEIRPLHRKPSEDRFRRKFEWGSYYTKYNIPKSSTKCVFEGCNFTVS